MLNYSKLIFIVKVTILTWDQFPILLLFSSLMVTSDHLTKFNVLLLYLRFLHPFIFPY